MKLSIEKNRQRARDYYARNKTRRLEAFRDRYEANKASVFARYGKQCECCGEKEPLFLTIDHVNNDGHLHRKSSGSSHNNIYGWLVRNGFPEGFQVLCLNCNHGKHRNHGVCPHQEGSTTIPQGSRTERSEAPEPFYAKGYDIVSSA